MAEHLTKEDIDALKDIFTSLDKDGDGRITTEDLGTTIRSRGQDPTDDDLREMIKEYDLDGTGTIDFSGFLEMMAKRKDEDDEVLRETFEAFDTDGDGYIDAKELKAMMSSFGGNHSRREINQMITTLDEDGDGKINFEEFVNLMRD